MHPPLSTPMMNRLELFNEVIIMICTCMLIGFTDYSQTKMNDNYGWTFITLASSIIGVALLAIVYETFTSLS
jgi:hypothetical protein